MGWYLTDPARDDLDGIWFHIAGDNVAAADKMVARLVERFDMLARPPSSETPPVAERHLTVAVGFNPRMAMTQE